MNLSDRDKGEVDFLGETFISFPFLLLEKYSELHVTPEEFIIILQLLASSQVRHTTDLSPSELGDLCNMTTNEVFQYIEQLVTRGLLAIGEQVNEQGTHGTYFDLKPLWQRLRNQNISPSILQVKELHDPVTLFEQEFGRPLSGLELEQIRHWLQTDKHPDWLVIEALREAVLANKFSFKYIDRILFDWQRNRIRTKQELEAYRISYKERQKTREEIATTKQQGGRTKTTIEQEKQKPKARDERYSAFYQLFPEN